MSRIDDADDVAIGDANDVAIGDGGRGAEQARPLRGIRSPQRSLARRVDAIVVPNVFAKGHQFGFASDYPIVEPTLPKAIDRHDPLYLTRGQRLECLDNRGNGRWAFAQENDCVQMVGQDLPAIDGQADEASRQRQQLLLNRS